MADTTTDPFMVTDQTDWTPRQRIDEQLRLAQKHNVSTVWISREDMVSLLHDHDTLARASSDVASALLEIPVGQAG